MEIATLTAELNLYKDLDRRKKAKTSNQVSESTEPVCQTEVVEEIEGHVQEQEIVETPVPKHHRFPDKPSSSHPYVPPRGRHNYYFQSRNVSRRLEY